MPHTPLGLLKQQLNLDHDLDDALLTHKLNAAEDWIGSYIGAPLTEPVPASVTEAVLQLAAFWYGQRESASELRTLPVPFGVHVLLAPHRAAVVGHVIEEDDDASA